MLPDWPRDQKGRILSKKLAREMGLVDESFKPTGKKYDPAEDPRGQVEEPRQTPEVAPQSFPVDDGAVERLGLRNAKFRDSTASQKKRGRPTKEQAEQKRKDEFYARTKPDPELSTAISGGVTVLFEVLATRNGAHWRLTPAESEALGTSYARVLLKYGLPIEYVPEVLAVGATAAILSRILADGRKAPPKPRVVDHKPPPSGPTTAKPAPKSSNSPEVKAVQ